MSLIVEYSEVVAVAFGQAQAVNVHRQTLLGAVYTTQVNDELSVDKHPHVIVTGERKYLSSLILENADKHHGEREISAPFLSSVVNVISETCIVDCEKLLEIAFEDSVTTRGLCCVAAGVCLGQCDVSGDINGVPCCCSIGPQIMVECVK